MDAFKKPARILLIRHGQSDLNVELRLSGHTDPPLTELGLAQVEALVRMLEKRTIHRVISSPFQRAARMAGRIAETHGLPVETCDGFKEQNFGEWEGKTFPEIAGLVPGGFQGLMRGPFLTRFPAGEGTERFAARVIETFHDFVLPGAEGKTTALVTHMGVIAVLLCHFLGLDPFSNFFRFKLDNGSATLVSRHEGGVYRIEYINRAP